MSSLKIRDFNSYIPNVQRPVVVNPKYFWNFLNKDKSSILLLNIISYPDEETNTG